MKFILCFCSGICISGTSCHKKSLDVKDNSSISFQRILWVGCSLGEDGTAVTAPANGRESQWVCTGFRKPSKRSIAVVSGKARQGKKIPVDLGTSNVELHLKYWVRYIAFNWSVPT